MMRQLRGTFVIWALALLWPALVVAQTDLERARALYNEGLYDDSIAAAMLAKNKPAAAPSAALIAARARLERFRKGKDPKDLATARADLVSLNPRNLAPQEAIEWQIGLGTALFLDDQPGPAADMFTSVLPSARAKISPAELEKLVEWWAATLSKVAEALTGSARKEAYLAMRSAVREELDRNPLSRPATYWTVVSRRGTGDLDGAWNAAVAGWIRVGSQPDAKEFRGDLERFVTQTLIPERAQLRTGQRLDSRATMSEIAVMNEEWRAIAARWSDGPAPSAGAATPPS